MGRIEEAAATLRRFESDNQTVFGPIQRNHLQIQIARQPEQTQLLQIPDDNTTRQAAALDRELQQLHQQEQQRARDSEHHMRTIKIEINNTLLDVRVDIRSLQTALSLPQHDIFHEGIYNGYQHPEINEEDNVEDVDHESVDEGLTQDNVQPNSEQRDSQQPNN